MRIQSDDGEFSIEIPQKHDYFYQKSGFEVGNNNSTYELKEMNLFTAYYDGTLLSVETYEAKSGAITALADLEQRDSKFENITLNEIKAKQIIKKTDSYYSVKRYFNSKKHIYVLSAASRSGSTEAMKRFFDSLRFTPGTVDFAPGAKSFSSLPVSKINVKTIGVKTSSVNPVDETKEGVNYKRLAIVSKPRPTYTDNARVGGTQGTIQVRLKFNADGFIPSIEVIKDLPNGLLRQVIFAAIRIKFLPAVEKGMPIDLDRVVEYTFSIY